MIQCLLPVATQLSRRKMEDLCVPGRSRNTLHYQAPLIRDSMWKYSDPVKRIRSNELSAIGH